MRRNNYIGEKGGFRSHARMLNFRTVKGYFFPFRWGFRQLNDEALARAVLVFVGIVILLALLMVVFTEPINALTGAMNGLIGDGKVSAQTRNSFESSLQWWQGGIMLVGILGLVFWGLVRANDR